MYNTYRNEINIKTGKKKTLSKEKLNNEESKVTEMTLLNQVGELLEKQLEEMKNRPKDEKFDPFHISNYKEYKHIKKNTTQNSPKNTNTIGNENKEMGTHKQYSQTMTMSVNNTNTWNNMNTNKTLKKTIKKEKEENYPPDYDTYKKNFETRRQEETLNKENNINKGELLLNTKNSNGEFKNIQSNFEGVGVGNSYNLPYLKENTNRKNFNSNPWIKYEYNHPGTFVGKIILNLLF